MNKMQVYTENPVDGVPDGNRWNDDVTWLQVSKDTAAHSNFFTSFAAPVLFLLLFNVFKKNNLELFQNQL